jgi:soluble lytic murein transglycosylase-like protein
VDGTTFAETQRAGDSSIETAFAVPRVTVRGDDEVALPQPLSPGEAAQIRRILALQAGEHFPEAASDTERLEVPWMLGAVLADRYLNPAYRPTPAELSAWLTRFGDQPEAASIRGLLHRLAPYPATPAAVAAHSALRPAAALRIRGLFVANRDAEAVAAGMPWLAAPVNSHAGDPLFVAGLAAWRLDQLPVARDFFIAAYTAGETEAARAAAAFWMARVEQRAQNRGDQTVWLRRAAQETATFYGHLARRALDPSPTCLAAGTIGGADTDVLLATPQGRRTFALLQIGERRRAESELRALWLDTRPDPNYVRPLLLVARAVGLAQFAADVQSDGLAAEQAAGQRTLPRLRPNGGFTVDPPLVYALVRRESNFQTDAVSQTGARGLMQILPTTAIDIGALPTDQADRLHDPAVNLAVGQRYLLRLAEDPDVGGNLLRLLAAYTQGPTGMKRWADAVHDDGDPLVFIEAIPNAAIVAYVQSALLTAWDYAAAMHRTSTSLDALEVSTYPRLERATRSAIREPEPCRTDLSAR